MIIFPNAICKKRTDKTICLNPSKSVEINPNLSIAYARKGTIYYSMGQTQNASINWNIALKLDPEYNEVREVLEALKDNKIKPANLEEDTK